MKVKCILIFIIMLFSVYSYAETNIISDVLVNGLRNVKLNDVLSVIKLKKGKRCSQSKIIKDVASITKLGYFDSVKVHFDEQSGNLVFSVIESPYVKSIVFRGNLEFSANKLKRVSVLKEKDYYALSKLEEAKKEISALYSDEGYKDCKVEAYPTVNADTNEMTVTFLITENNKTLVGGIKIEGAVSFKEKEVLKIMKTGLKKAFKEEVYQSDLESVEKFYKKNGFIDYKFVSSATSYNDTKTEMFLTLKINEGNRYKIGDVTFNGNSAVSGEQMKKMIRVKKGQFFNQDEIDKTAKRILKSYYNEGYLRAAVEPRSYKEDIERVVNIDFFIEEKRIVYVREIYVKGASFDDKLIKREIPLKSAEALKREKLIESVRRIYSLGSINAVGYNILPVGETDYADIEFSIDEGDSVRLISLGFGYSPVTSLTGLAKGQFLNIAGSGRKLVFFVQLGVKSKNFEIEYMNPYVYDSDVGLRLSIYDRYVVNDRKNIKYDIKDQSIKEEEGRIGGEVEINPRINSEHINLLFGYGCERVISSDVADITVPAETPAASDNQTAKTLRMEEGTISSVFFDFLYDSRDCIINPSKGNMKRVSLRVASSLLGGDKDFIKVIANSTWFFPTFWKFVLSVNLRIGAIVPYSNQPEIPIYERFYIGGASTLRGYHRDEIEPYDGGEIMGVVNVEYKFPIFRRRISVLQREKTVVQGALFCDLGGICGINREEAVECGRGLYCSVGFGIRLLVPVPIRIDFGYGLSVNGFRVYLTLGDILK